MKLRIGKEEEREPGPLVACNRLLFCSPIVLDILHHTIQPAQYNDDMD